MTDNRLHASEASREIEIKQKLSNESQTCLIVCITLLNEPIHFSNSNFEIEIACLQKLTNESRVVLYINIGIFKTRICHCDSKST